MTMIADPEKGGGRTGRRLAALLVAEEEEFS